MRVFAVDQIPFLIVSWKVFHHRLRGVVCLLKGKEG